MYLRYLDDAGTVAATDQRHFVLAGVCLFERQVHYLSTALDRLAESIYPEDPDLLAFHGSHMLPGKGIWRSIKNKATRRDAICNALATCRDLRGHWALFGVVVEKVSISGQDPVEFAFEQIVARFDTFLKRQFHKGDKQRGLIILDKSTMETRLQTLARDFRKNGHSWGDLVNLADVPMFVDSSETRAVQFADLVSYSLWQRFERGDAAFFDVVKDAFDTEGGVVHGLLHKALPGTACDCPYFRTRMRAEGKE
jgi:hypothetical protein